MPDDFSLFERLTTTENNHMTQPSVTRNYNQMLGAVLLKQRPEDFIINEDELNKKINATTKAAQALHAKNDKAKNNDPRAEYNKLRQRLLTVRENAKNSDIYLSTRAAEVKQLEDGIESLLRIKKKSDGAGELSHVRALEHQIALRETELVDAKKEQKRAEKQSANAARALSSFDGYDQIKQLKAQLAA
jgi:hypothetical protein